MSTPQTMFFDGVRKSANLAPGRAPSRPPQRDDEQDQQRERGARTRRFSQEGRSARAANSPHGAQEAFIQAAPEDAVARSTRRRSARGRVAITTPSWSGSRLVAFGVFLGAVLYGGWSAGVVGGRLTDGLEALVGAAVYVLPIALCGVGALALVRSQLVDMRPFRLGLAVTSLGLLLVLGDAHGGYAGQAWRQRSPG